MALAVGMQARQSWGNLDRGLLVFDLGRSFSVVDEG
jgi:hypothetical protein